MKSVLQQIIQQNKEREKAAAVARQAEIDNPTTKDNRRQQKTTLPRTVAVWHGPNGPTFGCWSGLAGCRHRQ